MKFIADDMLGKLAKWLRILGYDTIYYRTQNDYDLIEIAQNEGRILLTRDSQLARNWIVPTLLIKDEIIDEQLKQVIQRFKIEIGCALFSRCPKCNTLLIEIDKEAIKDKLPEFVYQTYNEFWSCPTCNRYYWQGSHWMNIKAKVENLKVLR
ncbi:MAG: Mut7-C RNAse domain-containing protein [bacterium]